MKLKTLIWFATGLLVVYLCVAFITWEPNPHDWDVVGRGIAVWVGVAVGGLFALMGKLR